MIAIGRIAGVLLVLWTTSTYAELVLSLNRDISVPDLYSIDGLDIDVQSGHLWLFGEDEDREGAGSDAAVVELDLATDQEVSWIDSAPFVRFPRAVAVHPTTGNVFVFGSNTTADPNDDDPSFVPVAAEFTQTGSLVRTLDDFAGASAVTFTPAGELLGLLSSEVHSINQQTGATESIVYDQGGRGMSFDPITNHLFLLGGIVVPDPTVATVLREVDLSTGNQLSVTDLSASLFGNRHTGAITFNGTGSQLLISANDEVSSRLVIMDRRIISEPSAMSLFLVGLTVMGAGVLSNRSYPEKQ